MFINICDIQTYYEIIGEGTPILIIHGWGPDHRLMKGCLEPVFEKNRLAYKRIYLDLPGMGQTKGADWIDGSDRMLDFLISFIDSVIPNEKFLLIGESYAGYLTRGIVRIKTELVDGLFLLCPVADPKTQWDNLPEFKVIEKDDEFLNTLSKEDRASFQSINVVQTKRVWDRYSKEVIPGLNCADNDFLNNCLGKNVPFTFDVDPESEPYTKPTLILMGRQDNMVGYRDFWNLIEIYPRASFVILDKAGHGLQIEQDKVFEALTIEWLDRVLCENE